MLRTAIEEQTQTGRVQFDLAAKITNLDPLILRMPVRSVVLKGEAPWRTRLL